MLDRPLSVEARRSHTATSVARDSSELRLGKALERAIGHGHPWIFRDALLGAVPRPGTVVTVRDRKGRFLARGLAERGPIGVRVLCREDRPVDADLFAARIAAALELRSRLAPEETDALRLIHGEGDRLPGLVCDRYGAYAVLREDGEAIARWRPTIVAQLWPRLRELGVRHLLHRSGRGEDKRVVALEGRLPDELVTVREHGMRLLVDLRRGQKTGMFLDHRDNRQRVRELVAGLARGGRAARVANLFGYSGGFSVAAGLGGAGAVVTVDVAAPALELAERAWRDNGLAPERHHAAAVEVARWLGEAPGPFDLVIADPPSFVPRRSALDKGLAAYRALHAAALPRVVDGGLYLAASCSSQVDRPAFEATLRKAARSRGIELQVLARSGAGFDHPVPLGFPEGAYLKACLCRVERR